MKKWIYDIEVYPNLFMVIFKSGDDYEKFLISGDRNDLGPIYQFLTMEELTLIGYNSLNYDDLFMNYIIKHFNALCKMNVDDLTSNFYKLSYYIIKERDSDPNYKDKLKPYKYQKFFKTIDLMEVLRVGYNAKGLKAVAIHLKHPKIQDLPLNPELPVPEDQIPMMWEYNENDVIQTELIYQSLTGRLEMREFLSDKYGFDLTTSADSTIGKIIMEKEYAKLLGNKEFTKKKTNRRGQEFKVSDILFDWIEFKTSKMKRYLDSVKDLDLKFKSNGEIERPNIPKCKFLGNTYSIELGGIHSEDPPRDIIPSENEMLLDKDVTSLYPSTIINNKVVPEHLDPESFIACFDGIVVTRVDAKALKKKDKQMAKLADGLKISINTVYGLYSYPFGWLYDPLATYTVTINNQLAIMMLIEILGTRGINVLSANTDGILIHCEQEDYELVEKICKWWEQKTKYNLEETRYSRFTQKDVNNYIAVGDEVKLKGIFDPNQDDIDFMKGYKFPIISKALVAHFRDNVNISTFIRGHRDIYDFCYSEKVVKTWEVVKVDAKLVPKFTHKTTGKPLKKFKYEVEFPNGEETAEVLQRTTRFYGSNNGHKIGKRRIGSTSFQDFSMCNNTLMTLFNNYFDVKKFADYDVNYQFYIDMVEDIINRIKKP